MRHTATLLSALLVLLIVPGCGEEEAEPHGLEISTADSKPEGDAVTIRHALEDGETWRADVFLEAKQMRPQRAGSKSTIEIEQTFHAGDAPHSTSTLRYVQVESSQVDVEPPEGVTKGRFDHTEGGRPKPETRTLSGKNLALADTLYGSMMLAGLAGAPGWIPDRPIRQGESWQAAEVLTPRMVARLLQPLEGRNDAAIPKPSFRGTIVVDRIDRDGEGGGIVVLTIAAMVEVKGEMVQRRERGAIDMGYRVEGTATVDIRTGIPTTIDARATQRMDFKSKAQDIDQALEITLRAEARRVTR